MKSGVLLLTGILAITAMIISCTPPPAEVGNTPTPTNTPAPITVADTEPQKTPEQPKPQPVIQPETKPIPEPEPIPAPKPEPVIPPFTDTLPAEPAPLAATPHKYLELAEHALGLINKDRVANGLNALKLVGNTASQLHAEENLQNNTASHWAADGSKPYMRFTAAGGVDYVAENLIIADIQPGDGDETKKIKDLITEAQERFMESPGHRANILNKWHQEVSLGIAFNSTGVSLVQHFEGDYIRFSTLPAISGTTLNLAGRVYLGQLQVVLIHYDPMPAPLTPEELNYPPYDSTYSLGKMSANILPPPPPGFAYSGLAPNTVIAATWQTTPGGSFNISADLSQALAENGAGVYTVVVQVKVGAEYAQISNYAIIKQ